MKFKRLSKKKFSLCKVTIAHLGNVELDAVKGKSLDLTNPVDCLQGGSRAAIVSCDLVCVTARTNNKACPGSQ